MNEEGGLYNIAEPMEQPKYVLQFKEGSYVPKHESRTPLYKVEIHGVTEATFYKYNKDGTLNTVPQKNITCDAHSSFYTMFNPEIDFAKVFETHTPLKIEYQDA